MGEASALLADLSIVTAGHNRYETFDQIFADIKIGIDKAQKEKAEPVLSAEEIKKLAIDAVKEALQETVKSQIEANQNAAKLAATEAVNALKDEMKDSIPDWQKTVTKSQKWDNGKPANIEADVTVNKDGGTSVSYPSTKTFEAYMTSAGSATGTGTTSKPENEDKKDEK